MKISISVTKSELIEALKCWLEYNDKHIVGEVEFWCSGAINGECSCFRIQYEEEAKR